MLWKPYTIWIPLTPKLAAMATLQTRHVFLRQVARVQAPPPAPSLFGEVAGLWGGGGTSLRVSRRGEVQFFLVKFMAVTVPSIVRSLRKWMVFPMWLKRTTFKSENVYFYIMYQLYIKITIFFQKKMPSGALFHYLFLLIIPPRKWALGLCKYRGRFLFDGLIIMRASLTKDIRWKMLLSIWKY